MKNENLNSMKIIDFELANLEGNFKNDIQTNQSVKCSEFGDIYNSYEKK